MYQPYPDYLLHYGVLGMHWGIRRYQPYTHGQKGVFLNLRKQHKAEVKSLKREGRRSGDPLIKDANKQRIKESNKRYKTSKKALEEKFQDENWESYKQKVAETGSEKEVRKLRKQLSAAQLNMAADRINAQKRFNSLNDSARIKAENDKLRAEIESINLKKQLSQAKSYDPKKEARERDRAAAKEQRVKEKAAKKAAKIALKKAKENSNTKESKSMLRTLAGAAITGATLRDLVVMARNKVTKDQIGRTSKDTYSALTALKKNEAPKYGSDKDLLKQIQQLAGGTS